MAVIQNSHFIAVKNYHYVSEFVLTNSQEFFLIFYQLIQLLIKSLGLCFVKIFEINFLFLQEIFRKNYYFVSFHLRVLNLNFTISSLTINQNDYFLISLCYQYLILNIIYILIILIYRNIPDFFNFLILFYLYAKSIIEMDYLYYPLLLIINFFSKFQKNFLNYVHFLLWTINHIILHFMNLDINLNTLFQIKYFSLKFILIILLEFN